ncbi:MAG: YhcH/YjgK/YiaL family protein [Candidatus Omnitrophica bacterium]|nr:YhcH/YjgK/YiaL family protein [Candidatus Omnitrophota bacterium]MCB9783847.1 YhcH/YjgK/YiaL family protein [Candidatus Omnitrophota bacterium]
MIVDRIENWTRYSKSPAWEKAFLFLEKLDKGSEEGETLLEPDGSLLARVMSYPTRKEEEAVLEAHRRYIDIQMAIDSSEAIGWYPTGDLETKDPYDSEKDVEFFNPPSKEVGRIDVHPGTFVVLFPEDAHMPQLMTGSEPETVKKVVIKMRVDLF